MIRLDFTRKPGRVGLLHIAFQKVLPEQMVDQWTESVRCGETQFWPLIFLQ